MDRRKRNWFTLGLFRAFRDFLNHTSSHGMKYLGEDDRTWCERGFWLTIISCGIATAAYMVLNIYGKYTQTTMNLSSTQEPLWRVPFPAVTFCHPNPVLGTQADALVQQLKVPAYMSKIRAADALKKLEILTNPDIATSRSDEEFELVLKMNQLQAHELLLKLVQPCSEMLEACSWQNELIDCDKLFSRSMSHLGACCSFNNDPFGTGFHPLHSQLYGKSMGLTVLIKSSPRVLSSVLSSGVVVLIHDPLVFPGDHVMMKLVPSNSEILLPIRNTHRLCTEAALAMPISVRQCVLSHERRLALFPLYMDDNCMTECRSNFSLSHCGCVPYNYPRKVDKRVCDLADVACQFQNFDLMRSYRPSPNDMGVQIKEHLRHANAALHNSKAMACDCPTQCEDVTRKASVTSTQLSMASHSSSPIFRTLRNITDRVLVDVFLESDTSDRVEQDIAATASVILGLLGGIASLCLGCSLVTPLELFYFLTVRLPGFTRPPPNREGLSCPASPASIHPERRIHIQRAENERFPSVRTQNKRDLLSTISSYLDQNNSRLSP